MKKQLTFYTVALLLTLEISSCANVRVRTNAAKAALACKDCEGNLNRWF